MKRLLLIGLILTGTTACLAPNSPEACIVAFWAGEQEPADAAYLADSDYVRVSPDWGVWLHDGAIFGWSKNEDSTITHGICDTTWTETGTH